MTFPWQTMFSNPPTDLLRLTWDSATSNIAKFNWANNTAIDLVIAEIYLDWPSGNDAIFNVFVEGVVIWSDEDTNPPTTIDSFINTVADRTFPAKSNGRIEFFFGTTAASSGYDLIIIFENGWKIRCVQ